MRNEGWDLGTLQGSAAARGNGDDLAVCREFKAQRWIQAVEAVPGHGEMWNLLQFIAFHGLYLLVAEHCQSPTTREGSN